MAVAELVGVGVRRDDFWLLRNINWTIEESQRWVVLGPNGAGKTTLLNILSANLYPTKGMVDLLDEVVGAVDVFELRPRIGMSSASLAERIPRSETVLDVVLTASYAVVGSWNEEYDEIDQVRAWSLLYQLGIDQLATRAFGTLSEGERKRVQIARAMMTDPELLLLDEPAAGLDLAGRESLLATLSDLCQDPAAPATVLVTHHVEEIPEGITHALLLSGGQAVAQGPIDEVLTDEKLSQAFGMRLHISRQDGRWNAWAQRADHPVPELSSNHS